MAAISAAAGYREELGSRIAWLHGIARNTAAAEDRRAARARVAEGRICGRRLVDADDIARPEERIDAEREDRALFEWLAALPDGQRAVLELVAVDGLTLAEAAAALGKQFQKAPVSSAWVGGRRLGRGRLSPHAPCPVGETRVSAGGAGSADSPEP